MIRNTIKRLFSTPNSKFDQIQQLARGSTQFKANYVPAILLSGSVISFILWQKLPYSTLFPHLTISEYLPKKYYLHSLLLAPLNFQTQGHLLVYGPAMLYTFYLGSRILTNYQFAAVYAINSIITSLITVYYERQKNMQYQINMMSPKCLGAVTPLAFMCLMSILQPDFKILKFPPIPLFILPAIYIMYEIQEYQNGYVNELCRPAHLSACVNGIIMGILFKRFV